MTLTVGSLFSGIGGLDLGLERAGMKVIWQSEIDPYACKVLSKHWPEVVNHGDIKKIKWEEIERPNVICGGYPCQPFSTAGKRRGEEDPRHLWPWVRKAISQLRPDYAILENVRGHLSMGGLSVIGELASIGYDCEWRVVSAASVGANHRRDRIIIVAYPHGLRQPLQTERQFSSLKEFASNGNERRIGNVADPDNTGSGTPNSETYRDRTEKIQERDDEPQSWASRRREVVANPDSGRCQQCEPQGQQVSRISSRSKSVSDNECIRNGEHRVTPETSETGGRWVFDGQREKGYDGWQWWETEPNVGRVAHGIPSRVDRLRGLGNAVVPQVAEVIGRLVVEHAS
jgi:DNA (cytosine-5)-methyltransferase 1